MSAITISVDQVRAIVPTDKRIRLSMELTTDQRKAAIRELLGNGWCERDAFEFLRAEFPEWFEVAA